MLSSQEHHLCGSYAISNIYIKCYIFCLTYCLISSETHPMNQNRNHKTQVLTSSFFPQPTDVHSLLMQLCSAHFSTNSAHATPSLPSARSLAPFSLSSICSFLYLPLISSKTLLFSPFHQCCMHLALSCSKIAP